MALVIEDGTGITGADSYASVATLEAFAASRKITIPAAEADKEALLLKAADFLEMKAYVGDVLVETQGLQFPRALTDAEGVETSTGLPAKVVRAQLLLAIEAISGPLFAAARTGKYKRTKIDQIYVEYNKAYEIAGPLYFPTVDDLLSEWLRGGGSAFQTVRV